MQNLFYFFFFLSYVVSTQNTSLLFFGEGHMSLTECLQNWINVRGKTPFPSSFERLPLGSHEEGFLDVDTY